MSNNKSTQRHHSKTYQDCAKALGTLISYIEEECGDLGKAEVHIIHRDDGAPAFALVPDDLEVARLGEYLVAMFGDNEEGRVGES
jgi:hypothetical protein